MSAQMSQPDGLRCEQDALRTRWISAGGEVSLPRVQKGIFQYVMKGHYDVELMSLVWKLFDEFAAANSGKLHAFADLSALSGYDSETRRVAAQGFSDRSPRWDAFHALLPSGLTSRLLSMAFGIINMVSRVPMKTYTDRKSFEAARAKALGASG